MAGGLLQLVAYGAQDSYLSGSGNYPRFFRVSYNRDYSEFNIFRNDGHKIEFKEKDKSKPTNKIKKNVLHENGHGECIICRRENQLLYYGECSENCETKHILCMDCIQDIAKNHDTFKCPS